MRLAIAMSFLFLAVPAARAADPVVYPCSVGPDLSGKWTGCWISDKNGHNGPLRACVRQQSDGSYRFIFAGRFFKVIPFAYAVTLRVAEVRGDSAILTGSLNLGPGLGTFETVAVATATSFEARFTARSDSGRFSMTKR